MKARATGRAVLCMAALSLGIAQAAQAQSQRDILEELYTVTGGNSWTNSTNWLNPMESECNWYGVHCDENNNVTNISLGNNNLAGEIPASLGQLVNLTELNLGYSEVTGSIPTELGS